MLTTEDEAKTKRCQEGYAASDGVTTNGTVTSTAIPAPIVQVSSYGAGYATAAVQMATAPLNCIGSACMAWRWHRGSAYVLVDGTTNHFTEHEGKGEYSKTHGYCGKAGKP